MILKMTAATILFVTVVMLAWRAWHREEYHTAAQKLAVGLLFGVCSVISSHIGIEEANMVLNVRDLGPLSAGLFFDPLSGILAGLIGGIERFIIGEYFGIGSFTRVACSLSTILAGLLSALLSRVVFQGRRPSVFNCMYIGAVMEVFHMYSVFLTNRDDLATASAVVRICAPPMIAFTGLGLALSSFFIARRTGYKIGFFLKKKRDRTPIDMRFQGGMFFVVLIVSAFSFVMNYSYQTRRANEKAKSQLMLEQKQYQYDYEDEFRPETDMAPLREKMNSMGATTDYNYLLVDADLMLEYGPFTSAAGDPAYPQEVELIRANANREPYRGYFERMGAALCCSVRLNDRFYIQIGIREYTLYADRVTQMYETSFLEILTVTALYLLIGWLVNHVIVRNLDSVNRSLAKITAGNLSETVDVRESSEFTELSGSINKTVTALREMIDAAEKRMQEELLLATEIQNSALPKNFNTPAKNIDIYAMMTPARQVGGDFYDFFFVNIGQLALVMADVSGKGVPAAMFMMRAKTAIKNFAREGMAPAAILEKVNDELYEDNDAHMFVTVWLGILDLETGEMRCANAGHEYPMLKRAGEDYATLEDEHGFVLGGMKGVGMEEYVIRMNPGDRLFVYTDGIPEARNPQNELCGMRRMTEYLNRVKDEPQERVLGGVLDSVREFAQGAEQSDDITMLGITFIERRPGNAPA